MNNDMKQQTDSYGNQALARRHRRSVSLTDYDDITELFQQLAIPDKEKLREEYKDRKSGMKREKVNHDKAWKKKRNKKIRTHAGYEKINPQVGYDLTDLKKRHDLALAKFRSAFKSVTEATRDSTSLSPDVLRFLSQAEGLITTMYVLSLQTTISGVVGVVSLYLRSINPDFSLVSIASSLIQGVLDDEKNDADEIETQSGHEYIELFKKAIFDWNKFRENVFFSKISLILSVLVSYGLCDAAKIPFCSKGLGLFSTEMITKHLSTGDIVQAMLDTALYFIEGGYQLFVHGDITPLLFGDKDIREFEEDFCTCKTLIKCVRVGSLAEQTPCLSEGELQALIRKCIETSTRLARNAKTNWEKQIFSSRKQQLLDLQVQFEADRTKGGLRIEPYTFLLHGPSAQGKSIVNGILIDAFLLANDLDVDPTLRVNLNEADKFLSNVRGNTKVITIDDICNTRSEFLADAPTRKIIDLVNNIKNYALMAEADLKGKIILEPDIVTATTNVPKLNSNLYSNEPLSILRRFRHHIAIKVKTEFSENNMMCSRKVEEAIELGIIDRDLPDVWDFHVTKYRAIFNGNRTIPEEYEIINPRNNTPVFGIKDLCIFISKDSKEQRAEQHNLVTHANQKHSKLSKCKECNMMSTLCECVPIDPEVETQACIMGIVDVEMSWVSKKVYNILQPIFAGIILSFLGKIFLNPWEKRFFERYYQPTLSNHISKHYAFKWYSYIPIAMRSTDTFRYVALYLERKKILNRFILHSSYYTVALILMYAELWYTGVLYNYDLKLLVLFFFVCAWTVILGSVLSIKQDELIVEISSDPVNMGQVFRTIREEHALVIKSILGLGVLYTAIKLIRTCWVSFSASDIVTQGALWPTCSQDISDRDATKSPYLQEQIVYRVPEKSVTHSTMSSSHVMNNVKGNVLFMRMRVGDKNLVCNALALKSGVLLYPKHIWFETETAGMDIINIELMRSPKCSPGWKIDGILDRDTTVYIQGTDFCISSFGGGQWSDLTKYLPIDCFPTTQHSGVYRDNEGVLQEFYGLVTFRPLGVAHSKQSFPGGVSEYNIQTFKGLCMAPLISRSNGCMISGFHLGGAPKSNTGVIGMLTQEKALAAISMLEGQYQHFVTHSGGELPKKLYGEPLCNPGRLNPKSHVLWLDNEESDFDVYGECFGRSTAISMVKTSCISKHVHDVCGIPQLWGPPKFFPRWEPWKASLKYSTNPSCGVPGSHLAWAMRDYLREVLPLFGPKRIVRDIEKLSWIESINGKPGVRFIDAIKSNTAAGYPLIGPKSQYLEKAIGEGYDDYQDAKRFKKNAPNFIEEAERMEQIYLNRNRAYPIFKACLKDEPTKLEKTKVRVFQSAPLAFQLLIRKYFLPIVRVYSLFPLISECAVGINCQGPEWNELNDHILQYGEDRVLAGDYSKYDLRMPAQLILAAFTILIDCAKATGNYTDDDIIIMRGIATDMAYPVTAFDGTLVCFHGSNPSGQNLTVYINSIVNVLFMRCAFSTLYPNTRFKDACALTTYGDDEKGTVNKKFPMFNFNHVSEYLAEYGTVFTLPDKSSSELALNYLHNSECDFLKRRSIYNPEVGMSFGALDEMSIFKSLHCFMKSKTPEVEIVTGNIRGALHEFFAHGRETYELRRCQLTEVAKRSKLMIPELLLTYDNMLDAWCEIYNISRIPVVN